MRITAMAMALTFCTLIAACASPPQPGNMISSTQGSTVVRRAEITDIRDVVVQDNPSSGLGSAAGAVLGGVAGSLIGGGNGSTVASIGGALAGGMAGQRVEQAAATSRTTDVTVRFDNGDVRTYRIVPEKTLRIGDIVTVKSGYGGIYIHRE